MAFCIDCPYNYLSNKPSSCIPALAPCPIATPYPTTPPALMSLLSAHMETIYSAEVRQSPPLPFHIESYLKSGDDEDVIVWYLNSSEKHQVVSTPFSGPVTCLVWIPSPEDMVAHFAFGCADGSIHIYQHPDSLVTCFAFMYKNDTDCLTARVYVFYARSRSSRACYRSQVRLAFS